MYRATSFVTECGVTMSYYLRSPRKCRSAVGQQRHLAPQPEKRTARFIAGPHAWARKTTQLFFRCWERLHPLAAEVNVNTCVSTVRIARFSNILAGELRRCAAFLWNVLAHRHEASQLAGVCGRARCDADQFEVCTTEKKDAFKKSLRRI